jgi:hypothetical protein
MVSNLTPSQWDFSSSVTYALECNQMSVKQPGRRRADRQTDRRADRQTDRQTDRRADRQTDRHMVLLDVLSIVQVLKTL